jgi:hypothetical protein
MAAAASSAAEGGVAREAADADIRRRDGSYRNGGTAASAGPSPTCRVEGRERAMRRRRIWLQQVEQASREGDRAGGSAVARLVAMVFSCSAWPQLAAVVGDALGALLLIYT